jgi:hypothetical protein
MRTNAGDRTSPSLVRTPGNLTDDDLTAVNGKRDQLEGKIQERYGLAKISGTIRRIGRHTADQLCTLNKKPPQ